MFWLIISSLGYCFLEFLLSTAIDFVATENKLLVVLAIFGCFVSTFVNDFFQILKVIIQLVRSLDSIKVPAARAMIIWMVGEYCTLGEIIPRMLSTVLKYLAWCFASEALETKLQILNTAAKVC